MIAVDGQQTVRLRSPFTTVPTVAAAAGYILLESYFSQNALVDRAGKGDAIWQV